MNYQDNKKAMVQALIAILLIASIMSIISHFLTP